MIIITSLGEALIITIMEKILNKIKSYIPLKVFRKIQPVYHFLLNWVAALYYKNPSNELIVIGVTGTTGKTTTVALIAEILKRSGHKVGYTSTSLFCDGKKEWLNDKKMTMIGRFFTQKILRDMLKNGCRYAIIETTSEGIRQYRHRFINYDILLFTGLYPEHIDSHGSFENYKRAKGELFKHLKRCRSKFKNDKGRVVKKATGLKKIDLNRVRKTIIANGNDDHADYFLSFWAQRKVIFSVGRTNELAGDNYEKIESKNIRSGTNGISFDIGDDSFKLKLLGEFNVANALAAISVCFCLDISFSDIKNQIEVIEGVAGRIEKINSGQNFTAIVDYAFEPKALNSLYETVKQIDYNKIIHVLGATGGGRDIARRPILGKIAGGNADIVIVSNEDPYDDDPEIIIDQVALGAEQIGKKKDENLFKILDRREAIKKAVEFANEGDLILLTGKGSEQAICVADGEKIKWDDRKELKKAIVDKIKNI